MNQFARWVGMALIVGGTILLIMVVLAKPRLASPVAGSLGVRRQETRHKNVWFRALEPALMLLGAWVAVVHAPKARSWLTKQLMLSGQWLGLSADELAALCLLTGGLAAAAAPVAVQYFKLPTTTWVLFLLLGAGLPVAYVVRTATKRHAAIVRDLPKAMDLIALSMSAGLDFPGALHNLIVTRKRKEPLVEELLRVQEDLRLGSTRQQALAGLAERVPVDAMKDLVASVSQAEQKGTPFAEALGTQAAVLRDKRALAAENMAANISQALAVPLMLAVTSVSMLLGGPILLEVQSLMDRFRGLGSY